jgi:hypothetical protein
MDRREDPPFVPLLISQGIHIWRGQERCSTSKSRSTGDTPSAACRVLRRDRPLTSSEAIGASKTRCAGSSTSPFTKTTPGPRLGHSAENFATIRHIALHLIKRETSRKVGVQTKRLPSRRGDGVSTRAGRQGTRADAPHARPHRRRPRNRLRKDHRGLRPHRRAARPPAGRLRPRGALVQGRPRLPRPHLAHQGERPPVAQPRCVDDEPRGRDRLVPARIVGG